LFELTSFFELTEILESSELDEFTEGTDFVSISVGNLGGTGFGIFFSIFCKGAIFEVLLSTKIF